MEQHRILIVSRSFFPLNSPRAFRATELAKGFSKLGHEVTVITSKDPIVHTAFEKENGIRIKDLGTPRWKPIGLGGKDPWRWIRRGIKRISNLLFLYPEIELMGMVKRALQKERDYGYDMLISIAVPYPVHFGVAKARVATHPMATIWVADCGDPFMGQENDTFRYPFFYRYVEKWFCRKADYITVPVQGAIEAYYPEFHSKIRVIPQGFDFDESRYKHQYIPNAVPVFGYAGGLIPGRRDPREFLEYLCALDVDFYFHLYTHTPQLVIPFMERGKGRIHLHAYIPRTQLLDKLSRMDFLVNFENVGQKQMPSKLIDYAIAHRPILSIKTGSLPVETIEQFLKGNYTNQYEVSHIEQYKIEHVCKRFLDLNNYECMYNEEASINQRYDKEKLSI